MASIDDYLPRPGLSTPIVTIFDREGRVLEDEQRALVRFVVQEGRGADIVFAAGTTGEWDRVDNPRRQDVMRIAVDECRRISARIGRKVEAWAGITAHTRAETIAEPRVRTRARRRRRGDRATFDSRLAAPPDFVAREIGAVFNAEERRFRFFSTIMPTSPRRENHRICIPAT